MHFPPLHSLLVPFIYSSVFLPTPIQAQTQTQTPTPPPRLNVTAISAANNASTLECWQLKSIPSTFAAAINFPLGNVTNATWSVIPPRTVVGFHNAPYVQLTIALSGLIQITTNTTSTSAQNQDPTNPTYSNNHTSNEITASIPPGPHGLLLAADLSTVSAHGHHAAFPSDEATVLVQFPFAGNRVPAHDVLYEGPCRLEELAGL